MTTPNQMPPTVPSMYSSPESDEDEDAVVDATTIADAQPSTITLALRRRWFPDNEATLLRFLSSKILAANIHNFVKGVGSAKLTLRCNEAGCVLCMTRHKATPSYMIPALFVEDREIAVVLIDQNGGPESLRGQFIPLLKRPNLTDLVVEVARKGNRHTAMVVCDLSQTTVENSDDYGTAVIRDALARGALKPKAIRASVEQRDNQTLLADLDWIAPKLRLYHPGLDLASL